jgi:hypothetical protein
MAKMQVSVAMRSTYGSAYAAGSERTASAQASASERDGRTKISFRSSAQPRRSQ